MKYLIGIAFIISGFGALAQESNSSGGEPEQQVLVDKSHEPISYWAEETEALEKIAWSLEL